MPTLRHNPSSQIVELRDKQFMVDCGEGTQLQLRRSKINFTRIGHVFISHLHGDHCFGLIGMISSFGMLGRTAPLHIYAHGDLEPLLRQQLDYFCQGLEFKVEMHPIDPTQNKVIYEDKSLTVTTIPLEHRVPCCGFLFREKELLPHIRRDMIDMYGIPLSQINNIKNGIDWTSPDGEVIPTTLLTLPPDPARSYAYCSDTAFSPRLISMLHQPTWIYHEATYTDDFAKLAKQRGHSTAAQAATVAAQTGAKNLILGHYSKRYTDEQPFLLEAQQHFDGRVLLANEGMKIDLTK